MRRRLRVMALKATIEMREELKGKSLSFTEITKLLGKKWQNLTASEKEPYEQQSFDAKEKCRIELAEYEQTESYKAYSEYLLDFNAKQLHIQESSQECLVQPMSSSQNLLESNDDST
ncbi:hypothetical protein V501_00162 [Pseudogymnoascus sp. VKM F-4519 (FW-2642)]|nr:hypothetical protein V501_00162 [Pseudogymnoascus sp. VKM F-4519 (FW-2642)]